MKQTLLQRLKKKAPDFQVSDSTLNWVLEEVTPELLQGPGQMLRSLGRGWVLQTVDAGVELPKVKALALKAMDALGLDMGAVSIEVDGETARVTSVTTAPTLDDTQMKVYAEALRKFGATKKETEKQIPDLEADAATPEMLADLKRKLKGANKEQLKAISILLER
jgi:hypothetical protein